MPTLSVSVADGPESSSAETGPPRPGMFDAPVDAWYVWVGLAAVALVLLGTVAALPTRPPPDAAGAVNAVDAASVATPPASATVAVDARAVSLTPHRLTLRNRAGTATAAFAYGPVTPVSPDSPLRAVLRGEEPSAVFDDREAFRQALVEARAAATGEEWTTVAGPIRVRHVRMGTVDATLVGW